MRRFEWWSHASAAWDGGARGTGADGRTWASGATAKQPLFVQPFQALLTFAGTRFIDITDDVPLFTTQEAGTYAQLIDLHSCSD